ncbi:MAG: sulfurtransferase TusA family protein [Bacteroidota bacterium]
MTTDIKPDLTLDLKGLTCPAPLLGARRLFDELDDGQVLLLIADCPGTQDDLFSWTRQTGNQLLGTVRHADGSQGFFLRKGRSRQPRAHAVLDMRGAVCPGPIVEARKLLSAMQPGEVLKLISNCPGVKDDIDGWALATGMTLLDAVETGSDTYEFYISRG